MATPLPSMNGGAGGHAGPSTAWSSSPFDSSGWNVNFGGGSITSSRSAALDGYLPYVLAAAALLIVWRLTKK